MMLMVPESKVLVPEVLMRTRSKAPDRATEPIVTEFAVVDVSAKAPLATQTLLPIALNTIKPCRTEAVPFCMESLNPEVVRVAGAPLALSVLQDPKYPEVTNPAEVPS
jgi:hypothetical protein